ncbi:carbohydrate ABC transporter permease [Arthrobacter sp. R4-81]
MTAPITEAQEATFSPQPLQPRATQLPRRPRPGGAAAYWAGNIALVIVVAAIVVPFFFTLLTSLRTSQDVANDPLGFPTSLTLDNFAAVFQKMNYGLGLLNSILILVFSLLATILLGALAAYPLARVSRNWTSWVYRLFIAGSTIPVFVLIAPLYLLQRDLGLLNSHVGVILAYAALNLPVAIFFYTSFFRQIPIELEEAAALDGASPVRIFFTVLFPLLRPITATLATFLTLAIWNDLIIPLVFLQNPAFKTVMVNAYSLIGTYSIDPTVLFPAALLGVAPLLVVFMFLQRQVVDGLTMGAVK